jgi:hypothetical protein
MAIHAAPERVVLNVIDLLAVVFGQEGRQRGLELLEGAPQPAGSPVELALVRQAYSSMAPPTRRRCRRKVYDGSAARRAR